MVKVRGDLTGQKFGRLTVVEQAEDYVTPQGRHHSQWLCKCDCGNDVITLGSRLKNKQCQSCGCIQIEKNIQRCKKNDIGSYHTFEEAKNARLKAELDYYGEFSYNRDKII